MADLTINIVEQTLTINLPQSTPGVGVPSGGSQWDFLVKTGAGDYVTGWRTFAQFLATLPEYDSHEAATNDGVLFYRASDSHDSATKGTLIYLG